MFHRPYRTDEIHSSYGDLLLSLVGLHLLSQHMLLVVLPSRLTHLSAASLSGQSASRVRFAVTSRQEEVAARGTRACNALTQIFHVVT